MQLLGSEANLLSGAPKSNSIAVSYPAGVAAGNYLFIITVQDSADAGGTDFDPNDIPAGFTQFGYMMLGSFVANTKHIYAYYKVADGTESGSFTVTWAPAIPANTAGRGVVVLRTTGDGTPTTPDWGLPLNPYIDFASVEYESGSGDRTTALPTDLYGYQSLIQQYNSTVLVLAYTEIAVGATWTVTPTVATHDYDSGYIDPSDMTRNWTLHVFLDGAAYADGDTIPDESILWDNSGGSNNRVLAHRIALMLPEPVLPQPDPSPKGRAPLRRFRAHHLPHDLRRFK